MSLRRRVLLGCLVVAAVLLGTDVVLASTFRSFLLGRVDQQVVQAADPLVHGRFRGSLGGARPGATTPTTPTTASGSAPTAEQRVYTEYYIGLLASDGSVSRLGPGLRENDQSAPKVSAAALAAHLSPSADNLDPFTVPATTRQVPPPVLDGTVKGRRSSGEGLRWAANRAAATWGADWSFSRRPGPRRDTVPSAAMTPM